MARWHVSTSQETHARASKVCEEAELRLGGHLEEDGAFVRSYTKRAIDNVNFVSFGPREWICAAGTLIFECRLGGDALPLFYARYVNEGLTAARDAAIGHYSICLRKGDRLFAFTDEQAVMPLFYGSLNSTEHVLGTSLQIAAMGLGFTDTDPMGVIASVLHGDSIGQDTFVRGVKRLFGAEVIEVTLSSRALMVHPVQVGVDALAADENATIESAADAYSTRLREAFSQIAAQSSLGLHVTGGLDTRTILATTLATGSQPLLMCGVGNSEVSSTKTHDLETARKLAKTLGLSLYEMDWSGEQPHRGARLLALFRRYGFLISYGLSEKLLEEMEGRMFPYPTLHLCGYGQFQNVRRGAGYRTGTVDNLVGDLCRDHAKRMTEAGRMSYTSHMKTAANEAIARTHFELSGDQWDDQQYIQAFRTIYTPLEAENIRFFNEFTHYLAPLFTKKLNDPLFTMPIQYQLDGRFQLHLIHRLAPRVLRVPIASGDLARTLAADGRSLRPVTTSRRLRIARAVAWRVLPPRRRHAMVHRLGLYRVPALPWLSPDTAKDASISNLTRRQVTHDILKSYPSVRRFFKRLDFYLPRLYTMYLRLHAIGEIQSASLGSPPEVRVE